MPDNTAKVVLVTGAAAGIGLACCRHFAARGYNLLLNDLPGDDLDRCAATFANEGTECRVIAGDISKSEITADLQNAIEHSWGRVDVLVANAGIQDAAKLLDGDAEHWSKVLSVNLMGMTHACKAVLPMMLQQKSGAIVMLSSINAVTGSSGMAAYDASKSAVLGLMRSLAIDHGGHGIRVNAISPGNTLTDFHIRRMAERGIGIDELREMTRGYGLLDRAAEPEEIASAVYFLASESASFVTGHNLVVDGGYSLDRN